MGERLNNGGLPIRNPWTVVDYASQRGATTTERQLEVLDDLPVIDCGLGDSPFGSPIELESILGSAVVTGALRQAIEKYPSDKFCEGPTRLIRERFGISDRPVVVFQEGGSYALLEKLILQLPDITPENELGMMGIGPHFPNVVALTKKHGVDLNGGYKFPYEAIQPRLDLTLEEKIAEMINRRGNGNGNKFIYLDNPNNPTGDFARINTVRRLVEFARQKNDVVIVDEAYGDAIKNEQSAIQLTEEFPNLIVVRGVAKVIGMAGLRLGYGVMSREIGDTFQSLQLVFGVDGIKQLIANGVMKPEILKPHIDQVRGKIEELKGRMLAGLTNSGLWIAPTHPAVPIMLVQGPEDFFHRLKRYQIVTEKGSDFIETYPLDDSFVRMKVPGSAEEVEEVTKRVGNAIK